MDGVPASGPPKPETRSAAESETVSARGPVNMCCASMYKYVLCSPSQFQVYFDVIVRNCQLDVRAWRPRKSPQTVPIPCFFAPRWRHDFAILTYVHPYYFVCREGEWVSPLNFGRAQTLLARYGETVRRSIKLR